MWKCSSGGSIKKVTVDMGDVERDASRLFLNRRTRAMLPTSLSVFFLKEYRKEIVTGPRRVPIFVVLFQSLLRQSKKN
jgi:hypothetical protein